MKLLIPLLLLSLSSYSQTYHFDDYWVIHKKPNRSEHVYQKGKIVIDPSKQTVRFVGLTPNYNFQYTAYYKDARLIFYSSNDFGQLILTEDKRFARLELATGDEFTSLDFNPIKEIK